MKTPEQLWHEAQKDFLISELNGTYAVNVLTGTYRALNIGRDRKHIKAGRGYNVIFGVFKWGHFKIRQSFGHAMIFDYDSGKIKDHLRKVSDGVYIGQLYTGGPDYKLKGCFTLKKLK